MPWFSIHVITDASAEPVTDDQWSKLAELTALYSASWGDENGEVTVTLSVRANTLNAAIEQGSAATQQAMEIVGWRTVSIVAVHAMVEERFRALVNMPAVPELIGVADAARKRGVSAQAMREAAKNGKFGAMRIGKTWAFPAASFAGPDSIGR